MAERKLNKKGSHATILSACLFVAVLQAGLRYTMGGLKMKKVKKFNWKLFILAVPGLAFLIAFNYVPLFGLIIPFKKMDYAKGILGRIEKFRILLSITGCISDNQKYHLPESSIYQCYHFPICSLGGTDV